MSKQQPVEWREIPGFSGYFINAGGGIKREKRVPVHAGCARLASTFGSRTMSIRGLHRQVWPELWQQPTLNGLPQAPAIEPTGGAGAPGRSERLPATRLVDDEGLLVDLDLNLIDEGGYFVDYAGKRTQIPHQGTPIYDKN